MTRVSALVVTLCALAASALPARALALERICDTAFEDCRAPLLQLIRNETVAIDVAFWFMEDARYSAELVRAKERGVQIRVLFDTEALDEDPGGARQFIVDQLRNAGIPMREKVNSGITHWKMMLFAAQNTVQFSGANHSDEAFVPIEPYVNYVDEVIYFTDRPSIVDSFKTMYDNVWTDTSGMMADYANVTTLVRSYPTTPIDPELNFGPFESFRQRSVNAYQAEPARIDAIIYRITDRAHTDALIQAVQRGVRIRLLTEPNQYRDPTRLWHSWNVDRLYMAGIDNPIDGAPGVEIRHRGHVGLLHEKLTLLSGLGMAVFGSSNWTSPSSDRQLEHNLFTTDPAFNAWARAHFDRKWFNLGPFAESKSFEPLPPDTPQLTAPVNGASGQPLSVTLAWSAGLWAHRYDVYFGTDSGNLAKVLDDVELGPLDHTFTVNGLAAGTTYYWRVVSRTMADVTRASSTWSFTTQAPLPGNAPPSVSLTAPAAGATFGAPASIAMTATASDSDGLVARVDFYAGSTLVGSAFHAPFTATWSNVPAGNYTLVARAVDDAGATASSAPVAVTVASGPVTLPEPWASQDIGAVGAGGSANLSAGVWTVTGGGADVWGTADAFHYAYQPLTGDGSIVARVRTVQNLDAWTKAGVMIRESLTPGAQHAFMLATPTPVKGTAFQRRTQTGGASSHTNGGAVAPPVWVRLTRTGATITAEWSADGSSWITAGSDTFSMPATVYVGFAVSSHVAGTLATATFDNVTVTHEGGGPPPNAPPTVSLTSPAAGAVFAAPASVAMTASASDSDGTIARVDFFAGSTLIGSDATSPYSVTWNNVPAGSYSLTARAVDNGGAAAVSGAVSITVNPGGPTVPAPWTSQDIGAVGTPGSASLSGGVWTVRGAGGDVWGTADALHFVARPLVGDGSIVARVQSVEHLNDWTKAGVMIRETLTPASAHAFMIVTPSTIKGLAFQRRPAAGGLSVHTSGGALTAPMWVRLTRSGATVSAYYSADGTNWTLVGSDTIAMGPSVYAGLALSGHAGSALATATFDSVTVTEESGGPGPNAPPSVAMTSPADGSTLAAPASVQLTASASDSDGTIARVEFLADSTLIATDTSSPYTVTWSNVPAGTYVLTARAVDNAGAATVSAPVHLQVNDPQPATLPSGWASSDIGAVGAAGSATFADGVFQLTGSGSDIWGFEDSFHFAYRTLTGDGAIVARVNSLSATDQWTKAGVMIRAALAPSSAHAMMVVSPSKGLAFQRRTTDGGESVHTSGGTGTAPVWVRLERSGSTITASVSSDGVSWLVVGSETIAMPATVYVGLPLTSHNNAAVAQAAISNVSVTP